MSIDCLIRITAEMFCFDEGSGFSLVKSSTQPRSFAALKRSCCTYSRCNLLRVEALQAASPMLRYTSLLPPVPHPLATSYGETAVPLPSQATKLTSQVGDWCKH